MNKIYIGYDPREDLAYQVAEHSIRARTKAPLEIYKLALPACPMLTRTIERKDGKLWCPISQAPMATEFAISRFCVPFLQREGWALFMDCDMLCLGDINDLFALSDDNYAVMCVQHRHINGEAVKMDGQVQTYYSRKNWSSVVLWNCGHPANQRLSAKELNEWPGRDLHAFRWLEDDELGEIPQRWNWLVGVTESVGDQPGPKLLHYTLGGPWFPGWKGGPMDDLWLRERDNSDIRLP
jgi:hypothetical protein